MNKIHTKKEVPSVELSLRQPIHRKEDFPMNDFTTEIVQTLVTKGDLNELFRSHLERAVNTLLRTELTAFLEYEKYDRTGFNSGNSRNGSYSRSIKTEYGELTLEIPRDRNGEFKQQTVPAYRRTNDTLEETVIHLFRKGITMSEIADLIEKMYGHHYTPQTMSNITKSFTEEVTAFKGRELHDRYAAIYMDATYIPLKRKTVAKEAIHIAVGIRPDGSKEVLSYAIAPTESITIWEEILLDLQERGLKNVLLFITDGLKGMVGAISRFYPKARFQHCCVHVSRNISHKVRVDDRKEVCDDFKMVYQASSKKAGIVSFDISVPNQKFDGMILGGIQVKRESQQKKKAGLTTDYDYVLGLMLSQNETKVNPNLELISISPEVISKNAGITVKLKNTQPVNISKVHMIGKIYKEEDQKNPVISREIKDGGIAPSSSFTINFFNGTVGATKPLDAGKYLLKLDFTDVFNKQWHFEQKFDISKKEAQTVNTKVFTVKKDNTLLFIIIGILVALLVMIIIFLIIYFVKRKRREQ